MSCTSRHPWSTQSASSVSNACGDDIFSLSVGRSEKYSRASCVAFRRAIVQEESHAFVNLPQRRCMVCCTAPCSVSVPWSGNTADIPTSRQVASSSLSPPLVQAPLPENHHLLGMVSLSFNMAGPCTSFRWRFPPLLRSRRRDAYR